MMLDLGRLLYLKRIVSEALSLSEISDTCQCRGFMKIYFFLELVLNNERTIAFEQDSQLFWDATLHKLTRCIHRTVPMLTSIVLSWFFTIFKIIRIAQSKQGLTANATIFFCCLVCHVLSLTFPDYSAKHTRIFHHFFCLIDFRILTVATVHVNQHSSLAE